MSVAMEGALIAGGCALTGILLGLGLSKYLEWRSRHMFQEAISKMNKIIERMDRS